MMNISEAIASTILEANSINIKLHSFHSKNCKVSTKNLLKFRLKE